MRRTPCSLLLLLSLALVSAMPPGTAGADPLPSAPTADESFAVGSLGVERFGSGSEPMIVIPGLASGTWTWYGTIAHELPRYTIYAVTLPGFAGRPAQPAQTSFAAFDRDFQTLLATRHLVKPTVIGHSLGGTLAIFLAERHPSEFKAIVAVDGLPIFPLPPGTARATLAARMSAQLADLDRDGLLAYDRRYMQTVGTVDPALVDPVATLQAESDPKAEAAWAAEDLTTDLRPNLTSIDVPFAEIMPYHARAAGTGPSYTLEQTSAFYASLVAGAPHARVLPIDDAGHYVMLDRPAAFYAALDGFLGGVAR